MATTAPRGRTLRAPAGGRARRSRSSEPAPSTDVCASAAARCRAAPRARRAPQCRKSSMARSRRATAPSAPSRLRCGGATSRISSRSGSLKRASPRSTRWARTASSSGAAARVRDHERAHLLAHDRVGHRHARGLRDRSGWVTSRASTSCAEMFSPPRMMMSFKPVDDREVFAVVHGEIAGAEPTAVDERFGVEDRSRDSR